MLRQLRSQPVVNEAVRNIITRFVTANRQASEWLTSRWRVAGRVEVDVAGRRLVMHANADDAVLNRLFYGQDWEPGELRAWSLLVGAADAVLDIGANTGVYALLSASIQPEARIYAFEPHPTNYNRLVANLALNDASHVKPVEKAVGDECRKVEFTIPADEQISLVSSAVRSFAEAHYGIPYKQHAVEQTTIDQFVAAEGIARIDIAKIDVEYYELAVLRGAERTLARDRPVLMCEVFDPEVLASRFPKMAGKLRPTQSLEIEELLRRHGYYFYFIAKDGLLRVADLHSSADTGSNFVFSTVKSSERFLPWTNAVSVRRLMQRD